MPAQVVYEPSKQKQAWFYSWYLDKNNLDSTLDILPRTSLILHLTSWQKKKAWLTSWHEKTWFYSWRLGDSSHSWYLSCLICYLPSVPWSSDIRIVKQQNLWTSKTLDSLWIPNLLCQTLSSGQKEHILVLRIFSWKLIFDGNTRGQGNHTNHVGIYSRYSDSGIMSSFCKNQISNGMYLQSEVTSGGKHGRYNAGSHGFYFLCPSWLIS